MQTPISMVSEREKDIFVITFIYLFLRYRLYWKLSSGKSCNVPERHAKYNKPEFWETYKIEPGFTTYLDDAINYICKHPFRAGFIDLNDNIFVIEIVNRAHSYLNNQAWVATTEGYHFFEGYEGPFDFALRNTPFICSLFGIDGDRWPFRSINRDEPIGDFVKEIINQRLF